MFVGKQSLAAAALCLKPLAEPSSAASWKAAEPAVALSVPLVVKARAAKTGDEGH